MLSSLSFPHDKDNRTLVPQCVIICLVDGLDSVYDVRGVFLEDVAAINAATQADTDGQLWWETLDRLQASASAIYAAHDAIELALMDADFIPEIA